MNPFPTTAKNQRQTLIESWPLFAVNGFFMHLRALPSADRRFPWLPDNDSAVYLDTLYFLNHSGKKLIAPLIEAFLDSDGTITTGGMSTAANAVAFKYERNWLKLWDTMIVAYDPTNNYNVVTTRELSKNDSEDESLNTTRTGTESVDHGLTQETTHGKTNTENTSVFGYDSAANAPVPSDRVVSEDSGTTTVGNSGTDTTERDLYDDSSRLKSSEGQENEEIHKKGVIGTVSIQKLISEERGLWIWNFFDQVFKDIDSELTIPFYDPCR